ncbi:hypothetical protein [Streptomyces chartreusis]|uniref:hypothetical protein n=1 Tax=Streptomyces chartreusis TaxID=1969 RepID=UPI002F907B38|nr:hypothetical protein OG938_46505 [Streptomyces chartreusis]WTA33526.1 hypothetical protein OIA45_46965 [Streptomyces chartreusis]
MTHAIEPPWPPTFFELNGEFISAETHGGQHSWFVRAQNFALVVTWAAVGQLLQTNEPDEHFLVVPDGLAALVTSAGKKVLANGPAVAVLPPGPAEVQMRAAGYLLRVCTTRGAAAERAVNGRTYATRNPAVLPPAPFAASPAGLRVIPLADVSEEPGRLGRIFRTDALMINWFAPQNGPRDTDALSPHAHDDFEQASVTLAGDYVHHIRRPWTKRMRDWRPDEHVQVMSPSVTLIPPGNIHTTRAVGHGTHQLIDVFAPPRADFIENGWVRNQADYEVTAERSG